MLPLETETALPAQKDLLATSPILGYPQPVQNFIGDMDNGTLVLEASFDICIMARRAW
jgi:hypothetical protein